MNIFEMKCLRCIAAVAWKDRIRNENVRGRAGLAREMAANTTPASSELSRSHEENG